MAAKLRKMNFESIIQDGPGNGAGGFDVQTANGTAHWRGTGWNRKDQAGRYTSPQDEEGGPWQGGRSNRSGE